MAGKQAGLRDYNEVAARVEGFNEEYPEGRITTEVIDQHIEVEDVVEMERGEKTYRQPLARGYVTVKASVFKKCDSPDADGVGHSTMLIPGITQYTRDSELENAETSAVGRALAFIGFYAKGESLASKQEINAKGGHAESRDTDDEPSGLSDKQKKLLFATMREQAPDIADESAQRKSFVFLVTQSATGNGKVSTSEMTNADLDLVLEALKNIDQKPWSEMLDMAQMVESTKTEDIDE